MFNKRNLTLIIALLFSINFNSGAQNLGFYTFKQAANQVFTPLGTGANVFPITETNTDDLISDPLPIPFEFKYAGTKFNEIQASTNGFAVFGNSATNSMPADSLNNGIPYVLSPLWDDLDIVERSNLKFKTIGSAPKRIFVIEWLNVKWPKQNKTNTSSFQIRLSEGSNLIEFSYGVINPTTASTFPPEPYPGGSASIGIIGECTKSLNYYSVTPGTPATIANNKLKKIAANTNIGTGTLYQFIAPVYAIKSGNYSDTLVWNNNKVPDANSIIEIPNNITINVPAGESLAKTILLGNIGVIKGSTLPAKLELNNTASVLTVSGSIYMSTSRVKSIDAANTNNFAELTIRKGVLNSGSIFLDGLKTSTGIISEMKSILTIDSGAIVNLNGSLIHYSATSSGTCTSFLGANSSTSSIIKMDNGNGIINIKGSFSSGFTFIHGKLNSTINAIGTGTQTFSVPSFHNLKVNNSSSVKLLNNQTIFNLTIGDEIANSVLIDDGFQITGNVLGKLQIISGKLQIGGISTKPFTIFPTEYTPSNIVLNPGTTIEYISNADNQIIANHFSYQNLVLSRFVSNVSNSHMKRISKLVNGNLNVLGDLKIISDRLPNIMSGITLVSSDGNTSTGGRIHLKFLDLSGVPPIVNLNNLILSGTVASGPTATFYFGNYSKISYLGNANAIINIAGDVTSTGSELIFNESNSHLRVNASKNLALTNSKFVLNNSNGSSEFHIDGNITHTGTDTVSYFKIQNGAGDANFFGKSLFTNNGTFVLFNGTGNTLFKLDSTFVNSASGIITLATKNNPAGSVVYHFNPKHLTINGGTLAFIPDASINTAIPKFTVDQNFLQSGGNFYMSSSTLSATKSDQTANFNGISKLTGGTFYGTMDLANNKINFNGGLEISANGLLIGAERPGQNPPPTTLAIGNPRFYFGKDLKISSGSLVLTRTGTNAPTGGVTSLECGSGLIVSGTGKLIGSLGSSNVVTYNGSIKFVSSPLNNITSDFSLNTKRMNGKDSVQYNISIDAGRSVRLKSNIELGENKFFEIRGKLITGSFVVSNSGGFSLNNTTTFRMTGTQSALDIGSLDGILNVSTPINNTTGSIITSTRTFISRAKYIYSNSTNMVHGNGLPNVVDFLEINCPLLTLSKSIAIDSNVNFISKPGVITCPDNNLIFKFNSAAKFSNAGDSAFIQMRIDKAFGSSEFKYPIGTILSSPTDYFYRPVVLAPQSAGATIGVLLKYGNPSERGINMNSKDVTLSAVNNFYSYELLRIAGTSNFDFSIAYKKTDLGVTNDSFLTVAKYSYTAVKSDGKWNDLNTVSNTVIVDYTNRFVTTKNVLNTYFKSDSMDINLAGLEPKDNYSELTAKFKVDKSVTCLGDTVLFTSTSPGNPQTFNWDFGPSATPATSNLQGPIKVVFASQGAKKVTLIVGRTGVPNSTLTKLNAVSITDKPITENYDPNNSPNKACLGEVVLYKIDQPDPNANYTWSVNNDGVILSGQSTPEVQIQFNKLGNTQISVFKKLKNNSLCTGEPNIKVVAVDEIAVGKITGKAFACNLSLEQYVANFTTNSTYTWSVIGGTFSKVEDNKINVTWSADTIGKIKLVKTKTGYNCIDSTELIVKLGKIIVNKTASQAICLGDTLKLSALASGGSGENKFDYKWESKDKTFVSNIPNPTIKPLVTTKYILTVTDNGCTNAQKFVDSITITVNPLPVKPIITGPLSSCKGKEITLSSSSGPQYQWYKNNVLLTGNTNSTYKFIPNDKDSIFVVAINGNGCKEKSNVVKIKVNNIAKVNLSKSGPEYIDSTLTFTTTATGTIFNWSFGDGTTGTGQVVNHSYTIQGNYKVKLEVIDNNTCSSFDSVMVQIGKVGINELVNGTFKMFPNPSAGNIQIELSNIVSTSAINIIIHNVEGKVLKTISIPNVQNNLFDIEVNEFENGMYFVQIQSKSGVEVQKLLIAK